MMMTPVYDVATADWTTNSCGISNHAATGYISVLSRLFTRTSPVILLAKQHSFVSHISQLLTVSFSKSPFFLFRKRNNQSDDVLSTVNFTRLLGGKHIFSTTEVISFTSRKLAIIGTDVLWRQAKFDLKVTNCESTVLDGYIKEQPADHSTPATDEEK